MSESSVLYFQRYCRPLSTDTKTSMQYNESLTTPAEHTLIEQILLLANLQFSLTWTIRIY